MNVLSLFDGISCGQIALTRAGIKIDRYFASEIDKNAIKVAQDNYPDTVQLGDVTKISYHNGVLKGESGEWKTEIQILLGGSPCQGFSCAGSGLNFEDPRSKLFFEYVRVLNELRAHNPNVLFLLENVRMKKEYLDIISSHLGVEPIKINSALVSAQNRVRFYWTNLPNVSLPEDLGIQLSEIVDENYDGIWVYPRGANNGGIKDYKGKSPTVTTSSWQRNFLLFRGDAKRTFPRYPNGLPRIKQLEARKDNKSNCITCAKDDSLLLRPDGDYRHFSPVEVERLQTVPEGYTKCLSDNMRYKCLGNGWTVDVIAHILKNAKIS